MKKIESIKIKDVDYVDWTEADLRFTGWEHECIIIDRTENHYLIPLERYKELKNPKPKQVVTKPVNSGFDGASGCVGCCGTTKKD